MFQTTNQIGSTDVLFFILPCAMDPSPSANDAGALRRLLAHWQLLEFRHHAIFGPESLATDHCNHGLWMFMVDISTDS